MIYGRYFNLIHVPKTAGTWMRHVCSRSLPRDLIIGVHPDHLPFSEVLDHVTKRPTFAFVRNPWDWYVSVYGHWHTNIIHRRHEFVIPYESLDPFYKRIHDRFSGGFAKSLMTLTPWVKAEENRPSAWTLTGKLRYMTEREGASVEILRFEDDPVEQFIEILSSTSPRPLPADIPGKIRATAPKNVSERVRDYREYYTPALRRLVQERESEIIERYGYEF